MMDLGALMLEATPIGVGQCWESASPVVGKGYAGFNLGRPVLPLFPMQTLPNPSMREFAVNFIRAANIML